MKLLPTTPLEQVEQRALSLFKSTFPESGHPQIIAHAPGRVNLIGEHTDYNDGFVLPLALEMQTVIVGSRNGKDTCRVASEAFEGLVSFKPNKDLKPGDPLWSNYIKGVVVNFLRSGYEVPAFDAVVVSEVPVGGGVSSSASLEVAIATFIEAIGNYHLEPSKKALFGQAAEHEFANMPCGIMDQLISECAIQDCALLIDCRSLAFEPVEVKDPDTCILVCNSNIKHQLSGSEYPLRKQQCKDALTVLQSLDSKITSLRDANLEQLNQVKDNMSEVAYRRARHVISENDRTLEAAECLRKNKYETAGKLMNESHFSLKNDYEVSCKELDLLVDLASSVPGVYGSRMTGGGFGGCTVTLLKRSSLSSLLEKFEKEYEKHTGIAATAFVTRPGSGAGYKKLQ
ncbi:Galactokinase [Galdieria sulphuraria]|uniref:Galactokinase n=1 Tax=Galdieria sulphuraria TaxID=130081 RepID=M2X5W8_GALSU|nr:galactokinase [Galdieria sulphuraria]EME31865.1 galactokinase [Galdieria sulphuraria]GJD10368.1 Galactokinase [Galdieria sulphuraria]|eukprot:XP_005708385.1 galactokinase [Galdieria sulphuraria]